jgi:hypothetical protein
MFFRANPGVHVLRADSHNQPPPPENRQLHGYVQDNPLLNALLDAGNSLRYGVSEKERMDMVDSLSAPGVKGAAYDSRGIFDPAAAERYTSAYLFGKRFAPGDATQGVLHDISGGGRKAMNAIGVPGVGEERSALTEAESAGMSNGSRDSEGLIKQLMSIFSRR